MVSFRLGLGSEERESPANWACCCRKRKGAVMIVAAAALLVLLVLVVIAAALAGSRPLPQETALQGQQALEGLLPLHTQHFPQLRNALDSTDARYVRRMVSKDAQRMWRGERREILRRFLAGLGADFARLNQMRRVIGSIAPGKTKGEEIARSWASFWFRLNSRIVAVQVQWGAPWSMRQLSWLTEMVASLSARAELAMMELEQGAENSELSSDFNA